VEVFSSPLRGEDASACERVRGPFLHSQGRDPLTEFAKANSCSPQGESEVKDKMFHPHTDDLGVR